MARLITALALLFTIAACASAPSYGPAEGEGFGYAEQAIEQGRYRVTYRGTDASFAENGALRRAAELTRQNGFDYFTVVNRDLDRRSRAARSSVGLGGGSLGRRGGLGVGVNVPVGGQQEQVTARLEIVMGRGERPDGPQHYDARSLLRNLSGSVAGGN